ncbi:hypothetical protein OEZ49_12985 [Ruegeria sp. WL0004]|uniref:Bacterial transcriptional activator domain-containing protein n=1 Tax=Ruegeria marisflavi TaxID=2984152 RepID=A0ABT2WSM7_9RHOB|nr:BTAD domain-containing putative transcriptional regulator [Ruegeria sp. WL0004]MCU9838687.1 hypothetical protein [Ruegeria sp. WL0004]
MTTPNGVPVAITGRKIQGLLSILAFSPGLTASRDRLVGLLWSDRDDDHSRNSLRQALVALRKRLGDAALDILETERDDVRLVQDRISCDVSEMKSLADAGEWSRAAALYRGPLLDGINVRDAAFEEWASFERQKVAELAFGVHEQIFEAAEGGERLAAANMLLALEPFRERAHRAVMTALVQTGARDQALRQYEACRVMLENELGTEPAAETEALRAAILAGAVSTPASGRVGNGDDAPGVRVLPSIAVLPFANISGDPTDAIFADGIAEDIITALSKLSKLFVVARNSTFTYKGKAVDIRKVGQEQKVRYVLDGSVQHGAGWLRIAVQLIDATTGHHLWAQRYDRATTDLFEIQDELTREVTSALQIELTEGEQARLWASGTKNLEAWEATIQIPELLHSHRRIDIAPARRLAERALQLDPGYASAWAMLGWSYWNEAYNCWSDEPEAALAKALEAMEKAREIDDSNPDTLALLAFLHISLGKHDAARDFANRAMLLGPSNSFAPAVAANVELYSNNPAAMVPLLKRAMRLCPIYPAWYLGDLAYAYLLLDRREEAISAAQESARIDPDYVYNHFVLAVAFAELGRIGEARAATEDILRIEPGSSITKYRESPFQEERVIERIVRGLRRAGLPE